MWFLQSGRAVAGVLAITLAVAPVASIKADEIGTTLSGYGTVGGSVTSNGRFEYQHDLTEFKGATNQFDPGLDSRLGVQAVVNFGSGLSFTAQEVIRLRGNDAFSPGTEWLFMQYSPVPKLSFRLGRFADDRAPRRRGGGLMRLH